MKDCTYCVQFEAIPPAVSVHKWVGAQYAEKRLYGIPNDMSAVLKYSDGEYSFVGDFGTELFKWTGGCIWKGFLYGFPRTSNYLLKINMLEETIEYVPSGYQYLGEHHYGGVCTKDGVIYQPPRDTDHILAWDLHIEKARKINLMPRGTGRRYCGSILLPDGIAYFLPERDDRIIRLDTQTEKWEYIGDKITAMVFDAKLAMDGNIYGYSGYCNGLLKLSPDTGEAQMIHRETAPGAYGTKLGINGHLYSIPGNGNSIWEYNPVNDTLKSIYTFPTSSIEKFAGGATAKNGEIYAVPVRENSVLRLKANMDEIEIPDDIYRGYFSDYY